jgi:xylulokinase
VPYKGDIKIMCLVGLDIGTTSIKASAFDLNGKLMAHSYREFTSIQPQVGWSEINPNELFSYTKLIISEITAQIYEPVDVISISSQGQAVLPIDKDGNALYNIITTVDRRTTEQYEWWLNNLDPKEGYKQTGLPIDSIYTINKIMWHKQNNPGIYDQAWKFCCVQDYMVFLLCGEAMIDYSLAGRSMMLNPQTKQWNKEILDLANIDHNKLSTLAPSTTVAGTLRNSLAKELGLSDKTPIVVGGHDQACGAIGAGVNKPGLAMNSLGTVDALVVVLSSFTIDEVLQNFNYPCYAHANNQHYLSMAINPNSGSLIKWFKNMFCTEEETYAKKFGLDTYNYILEKASNEISNIYILPHFVGSSAPISDPNSTGAIIGLRISNDKNDICRALLDSLTYEMRQNVLAFESTGNKISEIRAIGGGAKSNKWLQIKADIFQKPVVTLQVGEAASLGAAILGGVGIGMFSSVEEGIERMVKIKSTFEPNVSLREAYEERYNDYLSLYPRLKDLSKNISERKMAGV